MSKIVYNPVHNKKLQLLPASGESSYLVDTKANILATTATAGNAGFASDTLELFIGDGTSWQRSPITFGAVSSDIDFGAISFENNGGYSREYIDDKLLSNIVLGEYNNSVKSGALRQNYDDKTLQIYLNGEWKNIITMTKVDESEIFYYSQERKYSEEEVNGHMVMQFGRLDIGAMPTDYILDGGTL